MTAPALIARERDKGLSAFMEVLDDLAGVNEDRLEAMRLSGTSRGGSAGLGAPGVNDALGNVAFNAAAFAALAEILAAQQQRIEDLEEQLQAKSSAKK